VVRKNTKAFDRFKTCICNDFVLRSPDFSRKYILQIDASGTGLGAVMEQKFEDRRHPLMFISKKLPGAECSYAVVEKECFAIIWAVKILRFFLEGKEFTVFTNHAPLQWSQRMNTTKQRLLRSNLTLHEIRFSISHIAGKKNIVADALSRCDEHY
jgi:hypothetical protein